MCTRMNIEDWSFVVETSKGTEEEYQWCQRGVGHGESGIGGRRRRPPPPQSAGGGQRTSAPVVGSAATSAAGNQGSEVVGVAHQHQQRQQRRHTPPPPQSAGGGQRGDQRGGESGIRGLQRHPPASAAAAEASPTTTNHNQPAVDSEPTWRPARRRRTHSWVGSGGPPCWLAAGVLLGGLVGGARPDCGGSPWRWAAGRDDASDGRRNLGDGDFISRSLKVQCFFLQNNQYTMGTARIIGRREY